MTTTDDIRIGGFKFQWIEIGAIRERSDLNKLRDQFGVYIFVRGTCVQYVGKCGRDPGQKQDLRERIGQYFGEKGTGATFTKNWMEITGRSYEDFRKCIAKCNLATLSTEEFDKDRQKKLFGDIGIIGVVEKFLIREFEPIYNILSYNNVRGYQMTNDEKNDIRTRVSAWLRTRR